MVAQAAVAQSTVDPWTVQSKVGLTDARLALDSTLMPRPNLSYIDYRSGIMASGDSAGVGGSTHMAMRVQPGSGLNVTVEMGNCAINTPQQGAYMCALDSQKTLPLAAASSTANRIDLVVARVYDDLNSAIASPSGVRKFTVEVWQGDNATGTPVQPAPPISGYTPLAAVYVAKNATSITSSNITDLRGPGLTARGGMRALYGADARVGSDAFNEPGAYPGEQRWLHTNGFQHQVYYGHSDDPTRGGWRGVHNCMVFNVNPAPGGLLWTKGAGTMREICRVTIPYPGTPYMVMATGRALLTLSYNTNVDFRVQIDQPNGLLVNWNGITSYGAPWDRSMVATIPPLAYGPFTTSRDFVLCASIRDCPGPDYGFAFRGDDGTLNQLTVNVYPSTVQPPVA
jgi:hypothetical protein